MTQVINLFGGPGIGKTTTSSLLFGEMKLLGLNSELVREYVKKWAYEKKKINNWDQVYLLGKQVHSESSLYDKVDWIVTDSPVLLSPFYEKYYAKLEDCIIQESAFKFIKNMEKKGIIYHNILLKRHKPYSEVGRYQTEKEAKEVDFLVEDFLIDNNIKYTTISCDDKERIPSILKHLGLI